MRKAGGDRRVRIKRTAPASRPHVNQRAEVASLLSLSTDRLLVEQRKWFLEAAEGVEPTATTDVKYPTPSDMK